jgi:hypothetical protein
VCNNETGFSFYLVGYGVYSAATAMIAARDGSFQNNHTSTAQHWDR